MPTIGRVGPALAPMMRLGFGAVDVKALDAAFPFDYEAKAQAQLTKARQLTIGIVGFGTFGQFLAQRLIQAGHKVCMLSVILSTSAAPWLWEARPSQISAAVSDPRAATVASTGASAPRISRGPSRNLQASPTGVADEL